MTQSAGSRSPAWPSLALEVLARWRMPEARAFRLRCDDGAVYVVVQDDTSGRWTVE